MAPLRRTSLSPVNHAVVNAGASDLTWSVPLVVEGFQPARSRPTAESRGRGRIVSTTLAAFASIDVSLSVVRAARGRRKGFGTQRDGLRLRFGATG